MQTRSHSGSRAKGELAATDSHAQVLEQEWRSADLVDRAEAERSVRSQTRRAIAAVVPAAIVAALAPAVLPLTPGFSTSDTTAAIVAAIAAATLAIGVVPFADRLARALPRAGAGEPLVVAAALFSAGAAAIHFAVAKMHFDEYTLFGVFFVGSGIAQLVWPIWVLFRRWRPLFLLAAAGNAAIVALWAVDRIWGLPLGPTAWTPDPIGFGDSITAVFEVLLVAVSATLFTAAARRPAWGRTTVLTLTVAVIALTALSLLSVLGVGSSFLTPTD